MSKQAPDGSDRAGPSIGRLLAALLVVLGVLVAGCYLLLGLPFAHLARRAERYFGRHLKRSAA